MHTPLCIKSYMRLYDEKIIAIFVLGRAIFTFKLSIHIITYTHRFYTHTHPFLYIRHKKELTMHIEWEC